MFLRTICFLLLPPTLQFRGREERPLLGAAQLVGAGWAWKAEAARGERQMQGKWGKGRTATIPPRPSSPSWERHPFLKVLQQTLVTSEATSVTVQGRGEGLHHL